MSTRILSIAITSPAFIESRGLVALAVKVNAMRSSFHGVPRVFLPTATSRCGPKSRRRSKVCGIPRSTAPMRQSTAKLRRGTRPSRSAKPQSPSARPHWSSSKKPPPRLPALEDSLALAREQLTATNNRAERLEDSLGARETEAERRRIRADTLETEARDLRAK